MRRRSWLLALAALCAWALASADQPYSEQAVKAAFLSRFADYVDWPADMPAAAPFTIAVLQDQAVASELARMLPNRPIKNRTAQVQSIRSIRDLRDAQMLYVGAVEPEELRRIVAAVATHPVLVVTSDANGLAAGSTVNFLIMDRRVRFEVSLDAAERAHLKIGSELLSVAVRVQGRRPALTDPGAANVRPFVMAAQ